MGSPGEVYGRKIAAVATARCVKLLETDSTAASRAITSSHNCISYEVHLSAAPAIFKTGSRSSTYYVNCCRLRKASSFYTYSVGAQCFGRGGPSLIRREVCAPVVQSDAGLSGFILVHGNSERKVSLYWLSTRYQSAHPSNVVGYYHLRG